LSLSEIRELIDMYDAAMDEKAQLHRFLEVLDKRRATLEQQREDIEAVLAEIADLEKQCRDILAGRAPSDREKSGSTYKLPARA
jgi:DNA-binding transcriptional MerR regulator